MLEWRETATGTLITETAFVRLRVWGGDESYSARIETLNGAGLWTCSNIGSVDFARSLCQQSYVGLLEKELERLGT
jgi:hypothetical protein